MDSPSQVNLKSSPRYKPYTFQSLLSWIPHLRAVGVGDDHQFHLVFQSLLSWIPHLRPFTDFDAAADTRMFQSLLSWIPHLRNGGRPIRFQEQEFQSLLSWIPHLRYFVRDSK